MLFYASRRQLRLLRQDHRQQQQQQLEQEQQQQHMELNHRADDPLPPMPPKFWTSLVGGLAPHATAAVDVVGYNCFCFTLLGAAGSP